jgi:LPXTG-motif cell wall-anchored protein
MAGGVQLPPAQGGTVTKENAEPQVSRFVADRIESDGSPVWMTRTDQLMTSAAFIGALILGFGSFIGWRRNRIG